MRRPRSTGTASSGRWAALGLLFVPRFTRIVAATFTALAGADFLQLLYALAQQTAEG